MKRRITTTAIFVLTSLFPCKAVFAAPTPLPMPLHALFSKSKLVSFTVRNDSSTALKLKAGDSMVTIEAGKTLAVKLPTGATITTEEPTATHAAGTVIAKVTNDLNGATINVR